MMTFLLSLQNFKVGTLSDKILGSILKSMQTICEACYKNYDTALNILKILYDLYPHIAVSSSNNHKENSIILLRSFYTEHDNYGPSVSTAIIDCMGQLCKLDPDGIWSKLKDNTEIAIQIAEFLSSNFQEVRLAAIKNLDIIFNIIHKNDLQLTRQNSIFNEVCKKVFVNGNLSEERRIDETVTRTASALHAFATIASNNAVLRQKALFALVQLVHEKKLNIDSTRRVLDMVAKHLNILDAFTLIETNLEYLISCWYGNNYAFTDFPYILLGCTSEMEFYAKYTTVMIPVLIANNVRLLTDICNYHGESIQRMIEMSYPNIMARCLLISTAELLTNNTISEEMSEYKNKCLTNLLSICDNDQLKGLLVTKLDTVIKSILQLCFDPKDVQNRFSLNCALPEPQPPFFSVETVLETINHIQNDNLNGKRLVFYCAENSPEKLQKMLLYMFTAIHTCTTTEDKVKALHRCTVLIDLIIPLLKQVNDLRVYFIRTISYALIHMIQNDYEKDSIVNTMCCRYFASFLSQILPENAEILEKFIVTFVSILVPIAKCETNLGLECTKLLNLLIVEHVDDLVGAIKTLDPFPQDDNFVQMQEVYTKVKYDKKDFNLENEIEHFLNTSNLMGSSGYRTEGLKYLKNELSNKKVELKELYSKLHNLRGFSEDCEKSILHRLICILVKLCLSSDSNESVEALRCLGELGPADLLTTVLQAEQRCEQGKWNPFDLVTGCVTALLSKYIVDNNIEVVTAASEALYYVLDCKEAKTVLGKFINVYNILHFGDLSLNYLHVGQAAQFCTAHFTALLYVELWCQERLNEIRSSTTNYSSSLTPLDIICQNEEPKIRQALQNILRGSYKEVGEFDALYACESLGLLDNHLKVEHYEHLQRWEQVALFYDIQVSQGNTACEPKLLNALKNCSLYQLPLKYDNLEESQYECAWRLGHWNIHKNESENSENYEKYKYFSLKAIHDDDMNSFGCAISDAKDSIIKNLRHASLESSKNLYEPLSQLQSLLELEDYTKTRTEGDIKELLEKWETQDDINRNEFQYIEPIHAQRMVILNDLVKFKDDSLKDSLIQMHLKLAGRNL
ncbi:hypothetical protein ILUMI_08624 [Ignelater luminosus]|uniref:FAT domain-containing protein n=1 Tax=Ignelater luminosus TaxID=2038154 RepID=A0A8K0GFS7_IGNLU|nr:hypothetical protein ILUMI_08624 [Ignelater luminosus]